MPLSMLGAGLLALTIGAGAGSQPVEDPAHAELRALRDGLLDAVNKKDVDALLRLLHPDVVVTWQNAEVSRKPAGVRAYLARMLDGPDRIVDDFSTSVTVDELTILHGGDTGVSFGTSRDRFKLRSGQAFDLDSRWSAAVVRHEGRWVVASFHASVNLFDNPLLVAAQRLAIAAGAGGLILGIVIGYVVARRRARRAAR